MFVTLFVYFPGFSELFGYLHNGVCPLKSTVDAGGMVNTESTAIGELAN